MAKGCSEKVDAEFLRWVLYEGRTKEKQDVLKAVKRRYPEKTVVLKNQRQLGRFTGTY